MFIGTTLLGCGFLLTPAAAVAASGSILLEDGSGYIQLEDGSGNIALD